VEDLSSLFFSELVAHVLQKLGVLGDVLVSNEFTPKKFEDFINKDLQKDFDITAIRILPRPGKSDR